MSNIGNTGVDHDLGGTNKVRQRFRCAGKTDTLARAFHGHREPKLYGSLRREDPELDVGQKCPTIVSRCYTWLRRTTSIVSSHDELPHPVRRRHRSKTIPWSLSGLGVVVWWSLLPGPTTCGLLCPSLYSYVDLSFAQSTLLWSGEPTNSIYIDWSGSGFWTVQAIKAGRQKFEACTDEAPLPRRPLMFQLSDMLVDSETEAINEVWHAQQGQMFRYPYQWLRQCDCPSNHHSRQRHLPVSSW